MCPSGRAHTKEFHPDTLNVLLEEAKKTSRWLLAMGILEFASLVQLGILTIIFFTAALFSDVWDFIPVIVSLLLSEIVYLLHGLKAIKTSSKAKALGKAPGKNSLFSYQEQLASLSRFFGLGAVALLILLIAFLIWAFVQFR